MSRLPFDPSRMTGPAPDRRDGALTVSDLARHIDDAIKRGVPARLRLIGEVSGFTDRSHWYFDLKDEHSILSCVMFASDARRQRYTPRTGDEVVLTGRVAFWGKGGRTQFYASDLEPVGAGELEARFRALCEELRGLGWFDPQTKRPLPWFPARLAVVTSRTGAALQDVLDTLRRRCPGIEVVCVDVRVQGDGAAAQVAHAIHALSEGHEAMGIEAIIVTRGGGSMEDLWAFNERIVAEAIRACRIPVVAAIGHETDTTIAELVADERCATPTQAAMRLSPDRVALDEQVSHLERRLTVTLRHGCVVCRHRYDTATRFPLFASPAAWLSRHRDAVVEQRRALMRSLRDRQAGEHLRVERLASRLARRRPEAVLEGRRAALPHLADRLGRAVCSRLEGERRRAHGIERELRAVSPVSVLKRGYSVTTDASGRLIREPGEVRAGDALLTRLSAGVIRSRVEGEAAGDPPSAAAPAKRPRRSRRDEAPGDEQITLF